MPKYAATSLKICKIKERCKFLKICPVNEFTVENETDSCELFTMAKYVVT